MPRGPHAAYLACRGHRPAAPLWPPAGETLPSAALRGRDDLDERVAVRAEEVVDALAVARLRRQPLELVHGTRDGEALEHRDAERDALRLGLLEGPGQLLLVQRVAAE